MDLSIIEPADDCDAIGCGGPVALGAFKVLNELEPEMPIEDRMNHALRIACDTVIGCQGPFKLCRVEKSTVPPDKIKKNREKVGYEIIRRDENIRDELPNKKKHKKK